MAFSHFHDKAVNNSGYIMAKTIITAALTGAITPHGYDVPETPEEIAKTAYECWKAGAAIVHSMQVHSTGGSRAVSSATLQHS